MRISRAVAATTAVLAGMAMWLAPAAAAADYTANACDRIDRQLNAGDTVLYSFDGCTFGSFGINSGNPGATYDVGTGTLLAKINTSVDFLYILTSSSNVYFLGCDAGNLYDYSSQSALYSLFSNCTGVPAPVLEAVGKSGECDVANGWTASWQQWLGGGTGGAVCTRTLIYSNANAGWMPAVWDSAAGKWVELPGAKL